MRCASCVCVLCCVRVMFSVLPKVFLVFSVTNGAIGVNKMPQLKGKLLFLVAFFLRPTDDDRVDVLGVLVSCDVLSTFFNTYN